MKTDFSINVQVNLGVTPELVQLVSAILRGKARGSSPGSTSTAYDQARQKEERGNSRRH